MCYVFVAAFLFALLPIHQVPARLTQGTFILTPERFVFSAETSCYPPSAVLIALDLLSGPATTHKQIWMSEKLSANSPLLAQVGEDLIAAASWGEISLFKPPDKLAHFKIPLPERSNNAPLVLAVAGMCIFSVQSVAQKKVQLACFGRFSFCMTVLL